MPDALPLLRQSAVVSRRICWLALEILLGGFDEIRLLAAAGGVAAWSGRNAMRRFKSILMRASRVSREVAARSPLTRKLAKASLFLGRTGILMLFCRRVRGACGHDWMFCDRGTRRLNV